MFVTFFGELSGIQHKDQGVNYKKWPVADFA